VLRSLWFVVSELLVSVLDESVVARLASSRSFERGVSYLRERRVGPMRLTAGRVGATVQGSESYSVELGVDAGRLVFGCSCPVGIDGGFCKHCVAVALSWLEGSSQSGPTLDDARAHLESLPVTTLVELLVDHALEDDRLANRLLLLASRSADRGSLDVAGLRVSIDRAFAHGGFVHYREVWAYVAGVDDVIDALDDLLSAGSAGEVIGLAEYALTAFENAIEHVDDSDGRMRGIAERLEALHLAACRVGAPDCAALAERLFERELDSDWDIFDQAALRYADVLGEIGLARYRELAHACWTGVPPLNPGDSAERSFGSRFRITRIIEALAEQSGSLAEQIAVRERDLASPYRFLQIAELCQSHGQYDAALDWAQHGITAFPDASDRRLQSFLRDEYRRRGRTADARQLSDTAFTAHPTLETYRELITDATELGEWPARRQAALELLRATPAQSSLPRHPGLRGRGWSELVRVLLWEGNPDEAWQAATDGGCTADLWLQLAERRHHDHPEDALTIYQREVDETIARKDKRAYADAIELIDTTVRSLFDECGRPEDLHAYINDLRAQHNAKRTLIRIIDERLLTRTR
jgi:uncharacterized Zn finger protein